eukprot:269300-Pelagomonas_calceolata.AAC.2
MKLQLTQSPPVLGGINRGGKRRSMWRSRQALRRFPFSCPTGQGCCPGLGSRRRRLEHGPRGLQGCGRRQRGGSGGGDAGVGARPQLAHSTRDHPVLWNVVRYCGHNGVPSGDHAVC